MIYLQSFKKINDEKYLIFSFHFNPFDEVDGLHQTKEELKKEGFLIEDDLYIEHESIEDKRPICCWNPKTNKMYYEYEDIQNYEEEKIPQSKIEKIENDITVLQNNFIEQKYSELMKGVK